MIQNFRCCANRFVHSVHKSMIHSKRFLHIFWPSHVPVWNSSKNCLKAANLSGDASLPRSVILLPHMKHSRHSVPGKFLIQRLLCRPNHIGLCSGHVLGASTWPAWCGRSAIPFGGRVPIIPRAEMTLGLPGLSLPAPSCFGPIESYQPVSDVRILRMLFHMPIAEWHCYRSVPARCVC